MQIGDYIHYRYSNYRNAGLQFKSDNVKNTTSPNVTTKIFNNQRSQILNSLPKKDVASKNMIKTTLEAQLNFFFNSKNSSMINFGFSIEEQKQLEQAIIKIFEQAMASLDIDLSGVKINYGTLSAKGIQNVEISDKGQKVELGKVRKSPLGGKKGKVTKESAVYRRVLALVALRDSLSASNISSNFVDRVNALQKNYTGLIEELKQNIDAAGGVIKGVDAKGAAILQSKDFVITDANRDFINEINELIKLTKEITNIQITGLLGEYIPAISQYVANEVALKGVQECLNELNSLDFNIDIIKGKVTGQKRTRKVLRKEKFIQKTGNSSATDSQIGDVGIRTNYTQDKVDVILDLPDNKTINASMKNVNFAAARKMGRGINIFNGVSVLNFLQDYDIFTNHYLNIVANEMRDDPAPESLVQQAHEAAKLTIALHALTGGVWGQSAGGAIGKTAQAEILVINDNSSKYSQFKVYFMSDLIDKVEKNLDLIKVEGLQKTYVNKWVEVENSRFDNKAAFKRVSNILAQLHQEKLKVSISLDALV